MLWTPTPEPTKRDQQRIQGGRGAKEQEMFQGNFCVWTWLDLRIFHKLERAIGGREEETNVESVHILNYIFLFMDFQSNL